VFDAFVWLLFGKDQFDRKDYEITPVIGGVRQDRADSEVVALLDIDGRETELKRVLHQKWVRKRGQAEETYDGTETLTNKRITARVNSQTSTTSPWAWNSDSYDQQQFTALANALTISADAGTPTDGQQAIFRFTDNGTARALTWTTGTSKSFRVMGVDLPTETIPNKTVYVGCIYNIAASRWDVVAVAQED
jgi:hypothetical protein